MMSRVQQRVAIGCPRSPWTLCTVRADGGGRGSRVCACVQAVITRLFVIHLQGHESFY